MKLSIFLVATLLLSSISASAAEGISVRFKVEVQQAVKSGTVDTKRYENAFLFAFGKKAAADIKNITKIGFLATEKGDKAQLHVSLSMYESGAETFIGEGDLAAKFGEYFDITWVKNGRTYILYLLPSRAALP